MTDTNNNTIEICLLGDVFRHIIVKPSPESLEVKNKKKEPYKSYIAYAGVPLLRRVIIEAINDELLERKVLSIKEIEEIIKQLNKNDSNFNNAKDNIIIAIDRTKRLQVNKKYNYLEKYKSEGNKEGTDEFILEAKNSIHVLTGSNLEEDCRELTELEIIDLFKIFNTITTKKYKSQLTNKNEAHDILNKLFSRNIHDIIKNMDIPYKEMKDLFEALPKLSKTICGEKVYPDINEPICEEPTNRLLIMLDYFQQSLSPGKNVLRQKTKEEYSTSSTLWSFSENGGKKVHSDDEIDPKDKHNLDEQFRLAKGKSPKILVIYDRNLSFCKYVRTFDETRGNSDTINPKEILKGIIEKAGNGVVIGIREKLDINLGADNDWLNILGKSIAENKERCIVIITADALRESGIDITVNGSLEQAVHQVVGCLDQDPIKFLFEHVCGHLVVVFRETLVVHVTLAEIVSQGGNGAVHICPNFKRQMQAEESTYGKMPGKFSIMLSAIVKKLYHNPPKTVAEQKNLLLLHNSLIEAIPLGIAACNFFFDKGFCNAETASDEGKEMAPFDAFVDSLSYKRRKELFDKTSKKKEFKISTLDFVIQKVGSKFFAVNEKVYRHPANKPWNRIDELFKAYQEKDNKKRDKDLLFDIVKDGIDKAITDDDKNPNKTFFTNEWLPKGTILCPFAEIGNRKTFDAREAEEFYALENLLRKYYTTPDWSRPLSIAVFGYPGTGKSSTVEEIIKNVAPKSATNSLEFNLAQFNSVDQLTEAFHQVQDSWLTEGYPPLVIFDEFDANFGSDALGWLKFFLAPMQDGEFLSKSGLTYHIRRAIFIFVGGTHNTFSSFSATPNEKNLQDALIKAKHGDFISRLKGYLNVQSINAVDKNDKVALFERGNTENPDPADRPLLLRRAILLRSLLEKLAKPIFKETREEKSSDTWKKAHIHDNVIEAFLYAEKYKYGARSMEAIIQMSRWINEEFSPASLPPIQQLEAHVESTKFKEILTPSRKP